MPDVNSNDENYVINKAWIQQIVAKRNVIIKSKNEPIKNTTL